MSDLPQFETIVFGKWILAGEHAVLRGHPALLFPVRSRSLKIEYWSTNEEIRADFKGSFGEEVQFLFWSAIERAVEILNIHHSDVKGKFQIVNNIPVGAGMGASAALCVAIGRWFVAHGKVPQENLLEFARQLENLFHNESSGADIAVAIAGEPIYFSRSGGLHPIKPKWDPLWYLSYSDKVSTTSRCVKKVKELWTNNPKYAETIDNDMAKAVADAEKALQMEMNEGVNLLIDSVHLASSCFERWGLIERNINRNIQLLKAAGALAAKPTGAGDGGFILSLWQKDPGKIEGINLIEA